MMDLEPASSPCCPPPHASLLIAKCTSPLQTISSSTVATPYGHVLDHTSSLSSMAATINKLAKAKIRVVLL